MLELTGAVESDTINFPAAPRSLVLALFTAARRRSCLSRRKIP